MDSKCLSLILLLFFSSCVSNRTKEALDKADSFLSSDPDSALTIVQAIPNNTLSSRSIRARHALLTAEAQDKCHIDEKEDSTILVAYNWYQRNGTKENRLKATYYMGVVRQNAGADIEAALYFKDAEALAEQLQDYRCLSLCEQHLRAIYARNYDQVRARTYAEKSLFAAIQAGDSLMADYCRLDLAVQDIAENNNPEAERQLLELIETVSDTSQLYSLANLALAKAFLTDTPPEYARARFCYNQVLQRNRVPLSGQDYGHLALLSAFEGDRTTAESYLEEAKSRIVTAVDSTTYFDILHDFSLLSTKSCGRRL